MPKSIWQNNITNNPSDTDQTAPVNPATDLTPTGNPDTDQTAPVKPATDRTPPGNTEQVAAGTELSLPGLN